MPVSSCWFVHHRGEAIDSMVNVGTCAVSNVSDVTYGLTEKSGHVFFEWMGGFCVVIDFFRGGCCFGVTVLHVSFLEDVTDSMRLGDVDRSVGLDADFPV